MALAWSVLQFVLRQEDESRFVRHDADDLGDEPWPFRQFVVGTGGASLRSLGTVKANSQVRNSGTHGVLKLTLDTASYSWQFIPVAGKTFTDSGTGACH